ncbi:MAG TPA: endo-1,4-beta-xylanase [Bryobacteraceae bacterium]|jgi:endo-1,4-beta-xylanase|nr:endo-1,4-beta-xylanase [Bryobacteraceae bacterium]
MQRRQFLKSAFVGTIGIGIHGATAVSAPRLRDVAASKNLLVGSAVSYAELQQAAFSELLAEQGSIVVSENDMKWQNIQPEANRYDFTRADALVSFAAAHDQKVRGHNLCWHNQNPKWLAQMATQDNAAHLLRKHIAQVVNHFAGHIHSWDVVNEAVRVEDDRPDGLRNSLWLQLLGPAYIGIAYRAAATEDPKALLTYNDYDIEQDGPKFDQKRKAVLQLLRSMGDEKIPIQALGLQSHLRAAAKLPDWTRLHEFMTAVEKLDLQIFVTELDVNDADLGPDPDERDHLVAALYRDYLRNVLEHRSVKAVLTWGLTDRDSWLNGFSRRHDQRPQRPLPFDAELQPKPALYAMADTIEAAPRRD